MAQKDTCNAKNLKEIETIRNVLTFVRFRTDIGYMELFSGSTVRGGMLLVELLCELALMPVD